LRCIHRILLDWELTPRQIRAASAELIKKWRALDDAIAAQSGSDASFASTFGAMISLGMELDPLENAVTFPKQVPSR
jgi:hypothetical protein